MRDTVRARRVHRPIRLWRLPLIAVPSAVLLAAASSAVPLGAVPPAIASAAAQQASAAVLSLPRCSTSYLRSTLHEAHVTVNSAVPETSGSYTPPGQVNPWTGLPAFCAVELTETDSAGNPMHTDVWLPAKWNGRFVGIGGAGFSCGIYYASLPAGYASASTDCGLPQAGIGYNTYTGSWALKPDGQLNQPLISDYASLGIHDMTVLGKAVTDAYFRSGIAYSYFDGCSTGGREALEEAQQYPDDYNGIVA
jgi:feruloyl esterase